ncbi:glycoside hydrolase family 140 protein [Paludisphaera rhizosphaerae]|uniref:glycoside hydrolase family 140 protein n=1 Tax=Paludisphaera rhizosphaerae TaxID=2711216 RepID=UPI0019803A20|nr:glycoside hydrolase family 140 protein [Paludisphaera rhizosphaerae]
MSRLRGFLPLATLAALSFATARAEEPKHRFPTGVSPDGRYLTGKDGEPFFYLGDTAWELFHRSTREEADRYLADRARKEFTVVQVVALAEFDGHSVPNAYGHLPLVDLDPTRPDVKDGPANDYWDHVDFVVDRANALGLTIGLLPTWGRYWHDPIKDGKPLFNAANAETYGQWIGRRYGGKGVIWILGGDRKVENDEQRAVIEAMARGLRAGEGGHPLITFHPRGGGGSSEYFHKADWLSFNMRQNGHNTDFTGSYENTRKDYDLQPAKPVIDGEPIYEAHPISFNAARNGHSIAADVRRPLYWDLFTGACGHTYGHHSIWQMWQPDRKPINNPLVPWTEALDAPGAAQMKYGRRLIESRPITSRIPDDSLIVVDRVPTSVPGAGRYRFVATRDREGTFAMIYAPIGRAFSVNLKAIKGPRIHVWWFDPRSGLVVDDGEIANTGESRFEPMPWGEALDSVLVLDDASKNYPPPGQPLSKD